LRFLGVNVLCNRDLKKDESWTVTFADMKMGARTLVWTAGVSSNELMKKINGLVLGKRNRGAVDEYLQAKGTSQVFENVFLIGDIADTQYSGLAQTAIYDGNYISKFIIDKSQGKKGDAYVPHKNAYNIGVGPRWSVMQVGSFVSYGLFPYFVRTLIDINFFLSLVSAKEVWKMYFGKHTPPATPSDPL
jgi:NADH dehydrogenase FAD-containing subunit